MNDVAKSHVEPFRKFQVGKFNSIWEQNFEPKTNSKQLGCNYYKWSKTSMLISPHLCLLCISGYGAFRILLLVIIIPNKAFVAK